MIPDFVVTRVYYPNTLSFVVPRQKLIGAERRVGIYLQPLMTRNIHLNDDQGHKDDEVFL